MQRLRDLWQHVIDLASIPRLSREETCQLTSCVAAARQGMLSPEQAAQAKRRLIEGHLWLAVALVKRSGAPLRSLSPLDLVQQGNLGLVRALDRFDFASGGNFTAYASTTIYYAILNALPMENTIRLSQGLTWRNRTDERVEELRAPQPLSLDAMHGEEDCAFADLLAAPPFILPDQAAEAEEEGQQQAKRARVEALLARLTPREQQVLRLRYGLDEADGCYHAPAAIARQLDVTTRLCAIWNEVPCGSCVLCKTRMARERASSRRTGEQPRLALPRSRKNGGRSRASASKPPVPHLRRKASRLACAHLLARRMSITRLSGRLCASFRADRAANKNAWRSPVPQSKPRVPPSRWRGGCRLLEALPSHRQAEAAFSSQGRACPPRESDSTGTAAGGVYAPACAGQEDDEGSLRREARVSTDAAGAFLRALRAGEANPDPPSI